MWEIKAPGIAFPHIFCAGIGSAAAPGCTCFFGGRLQHLVSDKVHCSFSTSQYQYPKKGNISFEIENVNG